LLSLLPAHATTHPPTLPPPQLPSTHLRTRSPQARTAREAAEARADTAEADGNAARAARDDALAARDDALAVARQMRGRLEVTELALQRAQAEGETRAAALLDLQEAVRAATLRAEQVESTVAVLKGERDAAMRRAAGLERDVMRAGSEGESLRTATAVARDAQTDAEDRFKQSAEHLALATGRLAALEHAAQQDAAHISALDAAVAAERDGRIAAESEVGRLREELARRPPLDILRQLDVESLMQRNLQAAAAMQSLLHFVSATGGGSGLPGAVGAGSLGSAAIGVTASVSAITSGGGGGGRGEEA